MGSKRVVHLANLPIKLLMPTTFTNIKEIALKTIPSASKIEIKRVLQSLYGFDVEKVRTLNMEGKKKKRGGLLIAKPDYKKAYVTLRNPLSINPDLYPIRIIQEDKESLNKQKKRPSFVDEGEGKRHWLDGEGNSGVEKVRVGKGGRGGRGGGGEVAAATAKVKFPWSSMRSAAGGANR